MFWFCLSNNKISYFSHKKSICIEYIDLIHRRSSNGKYVNVLLSIENSTNCFHSELKQVDIVGLGIPVCYWETILWSSYQLKWSSLYAHEKRKTAQRRMRTSTQHSQFILCGHFMRIRWTCGTQCPTILTLCCIESTINFAIKTTLTTKWFSLFQLI